MDEVVRHNSGNSTWTKGINRFSDLTQVEFERSMLGYVSRGLENTEAISGDFQNDVDWRGKALTPVQAVLKVLNISHQRKSLLFLNKLWLTALDLTE